MQITLSNTAESHIRSFLSEHKNSIGVRVGLETAGCTGFKYIVDVVVEHDTDDIVICVKNIDIYVHNSFTKQLNGLEIDYVYEKTKEVFVFNNPNTKNVCGCGESFEL